MAGSLKIRHFKMLGREDGKSGRERVSCTQDQRAGRLKSEARLQGQVRARALYYACGAGGTEAAQFQTSLRRTGSGPSLGRCRALGRLLVPEERKSPPIACALRRSHLACKRPLCTTLYLPFTRTSRGLPRPVTGRTKKPPEQPMDCNRGAGRTVTRERSREPDRLRRLNLERSTDYVNRPQPGRYCKPRHKQTATAS